MKTEEANCIPLTTLLEKVGCYPVKKSKKKNELWYHSPLHEDKEASFHVHSGMNTWYDFGLAKGSSVIDFVCAYLEAHSEEHTVVDALRWIRNMHIPASSLLDLAEAEHKDEGSAISLIKIDNLQNNKLITYLQSRGIPFSLARKYLKENLIRNRNTGKDFLVLGFRNEDNGYELRNDFFKSCIAPKTISFLRGSAVMTKEIHVFEGFMDFLSVLASERKGTLEGDVIVLNSVANLDKALPYIRDYSYEILYSWMDNDNAGHKTSIAIENFLKTQKGLVHKPMNRSYESHKDVNVWHMNCLGLNG